VPTGENGQWYDRHQDRPSGHAATPILTYRAFDADKKHLFSYMWRNPVNRYSMKTDEQILQRAKFQDLDAATLVSIRASPEFRYWEQTMNGVVKAVGKLPELRFIVTIQVSRRVV